jgi:hypothetical protein
MFNVHLRISIQQGTKVENTSESSRSESDREKQQKHKSTKVTASRKNRILLRINVSTGAANTDKEQTLDVIHMNHGP